MPYTSPESVFATAQAAMERGDWEAFFECIDRTDLLRLAAAGIPLDDATDELYRDQCIEYGIPTRDLQAARKIADAMRSSANAILAMQNESATAARDSQRQSLIHRDLVRSLERAVEACVRSVTDLAAFTALAERKKRAALGGGSVSSGMFVGERLVEVTAEGNKAGGMRLLPGGWKEPVRFVQKRGRWYIRFMPGRRARPV